MWCAKPLLAIKCCATATFAVMSLSKRSFGAHWNQPLKVYYPGKLTHFCLEDSEDSFQPKIQNNFCPYFSIFFSFY